ncbi:helix-turn-helix transcriptional regulator [Serratia marcescens]|jgi:AcrR family transcriptional regulator|uniref:TetR/AcrR family transcriptional regulator n=1 Tax=Bacteria TaxID=2 RepID=UPI00090813E5|nr:MULTISPECIES: helix-turn-helix domain-containing protein [Serratia]KAB1582440.1 helix-turn-helix transcriptional regulator [Serratia marcescens]MBH2724844.1 helix-turn-helix transcriptional regulator [Serratia marcescens]MBH2815812.1 helix-turn-helix transcriptional regulator [Serratia marcescens]MBH3084097.1 helix-turn-helix transcriptional regulator [Serratia marcescens]MBK5575288.1 helix-turn-helix transcriptional regulator [Serratia marcescens]
MKSISPLTQSPKRPPGRPREYDVNSALDNAADIFSERGYAATSIEELAKAMGVAIGSLYRAFKDKQAVFTSACAEPAERKNCRRRKIVHGKDR